MAKGLSKKVVAKTVVCEVGRPKQVSAPSLSTLLLSNL